MSLDSTVIYQMRTFVPVSVQTSLDELSAEILIKSELGGLNPNKDIAETPDSLLSCQIVYMGHNVLYLEKMEEENSHSGSMEVQINVRFSMLAPGLEEDQLQEKAAELSQLVAGFFEEDYVLEGSIGSVVLRSKGEPTVDSCSIVSEEPRTKLQRLSVEAGKPWGPGFAMSASSRRLWQKALEDGLITAQEFEQHGRGASNYTGD